MKLYLYQLDDAQNVINKKPSLKKEIDIRLRGKPDSINPVLILRGEEFASDYNYVKMEERFYFVDSVENVGGDLYRITLELDALETFKDSLLQDTAQVSRRIKEGEFIPSGYQYSQFEKLETVEGSVSLPDGQSLVLTSIAGK